MCWCEVADEPVVVKKSRPRKAGNSLEDKTATTASKAAEVTDVSLAGHRCVKSTTVDANG